MVSSWTTIFSIELNLSIILLRSNRFRCRVLLLWSRFLLRGRLCKNNSKLNNKMNNLNNKNNKSKNNIMKSNNNNYMKKIYNNNNNNKKMKKSNISKVIIIFLFYILLLLIFIKKIEEEQVREEDIEQIRDELQLHKITAEELFDQVFAEPSLNKISRAYFRFKIESIASELGVESPDSQIIDKLFDIIDLVLKNYNLVFLFYNYIKYLYRKKMDFWT